MTHNRRLFSTVPMGRLGYADILDLLTEKEKSILPFDVLFALQCGSTEDSYIDAAYELIVKRKLT